MAMLSIRAYARHRAELGLVGASHKAVQKAIASGRVTLSNGLIDSDAADASWNDRTDRTTSPQVELPPQAGPGGPSLAQAAAIEKAYRARLARLEWEEKVGKLVPADEIRMEWSKIITEARTKFLGLPSKIKSRIPALTVDDVATIDELVREVLEALAESEPHEEALGGRAS